MLGNGVIAYPFASLSQETLWTWERSHTLIIQRLISQRTLPPSPPHPHVTILIMYPSPHYVQLIVTWERCSWERSHTHSIQRLLSEKRWIHRPHIPMWQYWSCILPLIACEKGRSTTVSKGCYLRGTYPIMMGKGDHVPFCLIITGVAVHVRKVAHSKYSNMVILKEHVRSCWGIMFSMIVKLI